MKKQEESTTEKKKQRVSATYTLRALGENAKKLHDLELITDEELAQIGMIQKLALEHYITNEVTRK